MKAKYESPEMYFHGFTSNEKAQIVRELLLAGKEVDPQTLFEALNPFESEVSDKTNLLSPSFKSANPLDIHQQHVIISENESRE